MLEYTTYSKEVQQYIDNVIKELQSQYGTVLKSWELQLDLLALNLDVIEKCKESLMREGVLIKAENRKDIVKKNPSLKVLQESVVKITTILNALGLTPSAKNRIKENKVREKTSIEDLLNKI